MSTEYVKQMESFEYSSGESWAATSDAQNVDYGFTGNSTQSFDGSVYPDDRAIDIRQVGNTQVINATPDDVTSDFGNVYYPFRPVMDNFQIGDPNMRVLMAARPGTDVPSLEIYPQLSAGGGATTPKFSATTPPQAVPPLGSNVVDESTTMQNEERVTEVNVGQLGAGTSEGVGRAQLIPLLLLAATVWVLA